MEEYMTLLIEADHIMKLMPSSVSRATKQNGKGYLVSNISCNVMKADIRLSCWERKEFSSP